MLRGRRVALILGFCATLSSGCDRFVRHAPKGPPPDKAVIAQLCGSDLGGPHATLRVWRDSEGLVAVLELFPDPKAHARASSALYDSRGRELARIPVIEERGSPQALEADSKREATVGDSRIGETLSCSPESSAK